MAHTCLISLEMANSDHELFTVILTTLSDVHFTKEQKSLGSLVNILNTNEVFVTKISLNQQETQKEQHTVTYGGYSFTSSILSEGGSY